MRRHGDLFGPLEVDLSRCDLCRERTGLYNCGALLGWLCSQCLMWDPEKKARP